MCTFDHNVRSNLFHEVDHVECDSLTFSVTVKPENQEVCLGGMFLNVLDNVNLLLSNIFLKWHFKEFTHICVLPVSTLFREAVFLDMATD